MWKNIVELDTSQMTMWRMGIVCRIPKGTNAHLEYAVLIAFALQQRLQERASVLHYMYIACLVSLLITVMKTGPAVWSANL
jgi:hypothetical protein